MTLKANTTKQYKFKYSVINESLYNQMLGGGFFVEAPKPFHILYFALLRSYFAG